MIVKFENPAHGFNFAVGIMKTWLLFMVSALGFSLSAQIVEIPDPALQTAIRRALDKPEGEITVEDMERLTYLNCGNKGIESIEGLHYATNLTYLDLHFNRLKNLALPDELTNLQRLFLNNNQLTSLTLPENLTGLEMLDLSENKITSLKLPQGSRIRKLLACCNQLTSLTLPENLTDLEMLDLSENKITSLMLPEGLSSLEWLRLSENQLTYLRLPYSMPNEIELSIHGNPLAELEVLAGTELHSINLNRIVPISVVKGFCPCPLDLAGIEITYRSNIHPGNHSDSGNSFTFHGPAGNFMVQRSTNLKDWKDIHEIIITEEQSKDNALTRTAIIPFTDNTAGPLDAVFYRVLE